VTVCNIQSRDPDKVREGNERVFVHGCGMRVLLGPRRKVPLEQRAAELKE